MNAPAAEAAPTGIVGCYRALWKALERVPDRAAGAGHATRRRAGVLALGPEQAAVRQRHDDHAVPRANTACRFCRRSSRPTWRPRIEIELDRCCSSLGFLTRPAAGDPAGADARHPDLRLSRELSRPSAMGRARCSTCCCAGPANGRSTPPSAIASAVARSNNLRCLRPITRPMSFPRKRETRATAPSLALDPRFRGGDR